MTNLSHNGGQPPGANGADRRVHQRRTISPRLYVLLAGSGSDGILNDLSEGGIALDLFGSEPPGEYVDVDFEMPELGRHFEAKGRVTWRDDSAKKVGVSFVDLPETARGQIREWLAMKAASPEGTLPPIELDAAEVAGAKHASEPAKASQPGAASKPDLERAGKRKDEQLVQNLIDSFKSSKAKKQENKYADVIAAWKEHSSGWNIDTEFFSTWGYWRWVAVGAVAGLAVLLAIGVAAHRLPWRKATSVNVSKAGQSPSAAAQDSQNRTADNIGSAGDAGNTAHDQTHSEQDANAQDKKKKNMY